MDISVVINTFFVSIPLNIPSRCFFDILLLLFSVYLLIIIHQGGGKVKSFYQITVYVSP